jgi:hypothetical protein
MYYLYKIHYHDGAGYLAAPGNTLKNLKHICAVTLCGFPDDYRDLTFEELYELSLDSSRVCGESISWNGPGILSVTNVTFVQHLKDWLKKQNLYHGLQR